MTDQSVFSALASRAPELRGRKATSQEITDLEQVTGPLPPWLARAFKELDLIGVCFSLPRPDPEVIAFGDAMRWLSPTDIARECRDPFHGNSPLSAGLFPIGLAFYTLPSGCATQIADPLCIPTAEPSPPLISVSHETGPDPEGDLVVADRISTWISSARIVPPPRWHQPE